MEDNKLNRKFCVAPMMGYTTPYARTLYRILSKNVFLFTEMVATKTMIHAKNPNIRTENKNQNPIALQIGGSDFEELAICSKIAHSLNYDEINLNVGCPSKAVLKGSFGACLMQNKKLVRQCLESMQINKNLIVSLKCRIGIGKTFNYDYFEEFIDEIEKSGIRIIYVHARNAILNGVSPKGNRSIPPLNYNFVKKIKKNYPKIKFILNGGIDSLDKGLKLCKEFDGIMVGRLIQNNPFCLSEVDKLFFNKHNKEIIDENIIHQYFDLIKPKVGKESIYRLLSPLLQIFFGVPNSKEYKSKIHQNMKNHKIDKLEYLFLEFISRQKNSLMFNTELNKLS